MRARHLCPDRTRARKPIGCNTHTHREHAESKCSVRQRHTHTQSNKLHAFVIIGTQRGISTANGIHLSINGEQGEIIISFTHTQTQAHPCQQTNHNQNMVWLRIRITITKINYLVGLVIVGRVLRTLDLGDALHSRAPQVHKSRSITQPHCEIRSYFAFDIT